MEKVKTAFNNWVEQLKLLEIDVLAGKGQNRETILAEEARLYFEFERALCESLSSSAANGGNTPEAATSDVS